MNWQSDSEVKLRDLLHLAAGRYGNIDPINVNAFWILQ